MNKKRGKIHAINLSKRAKSNTQPVPEKKNMTNINNMGNN